MKMDYVDLFALPLPKKNLARYRKMAQFFAKFIKKYGALEYREFASDDIRPKGMVSFLTSIKLKPGEILIGAYVVYKSRAHRDLVNKKMMTDPQMGECMKNQVMPFDVKRMHYGGFKTIVRL